MQKLDFAKYFIIYGIFYSELHEFIDLYKFEPSSRKLS